MQNYMEKFKNAFLPHYNTFYKSVSTMVSETIFCSRSNPWWAPMNAFSNYVDWMYTHSIDVAMISLLIAIQQNYSKKVLQKICLGSLLHDIGKLLVPKADETAL